MAADFSNTSLQSQIEPEVVVQQPVQDDSAAVLGQALQPAAKAAGGILGSIFEGQAENKKATFLSSLENKWLDIADAVDQGANGMTQQRARMLIRQSFREATANDPTMYNEINDLHAKFITSSGLGDVINSGTVEQQAQNDVTKAAISGGWSSTEEYKNHLNAANNVAQLKQQLDSLQANNGIVTETMKSQALAATTQYVRTGYPWVRQRINDAMAKIQANPDQKADIVKQLNLEVGNEVGQISSLTQGTAADSVITPVTNLLATFNDWANNKASIDVLNGQIKDTQGKLDLMYQVNDPKVADFLAKSRVLQAAGLSDALGASIWDADTIKKLLNNSDPSGKPTDVLDTSTSSTMYLQNIKDVAGKITTATDPETIQEVKTNLSNVVDGIYTNSLAVSDPTAFRESIETIGSPQVKNFLANNGGLDSKHAQQAAGVLRQQYETALIPAIDNEWTKQTTVLGNDGKTPVFSSLDKLIEPKWNGNAVEFVPKPEYANNSQVIDYATSANSGSIAIATPLNNLINAYSSLTGEDPQKIYEDQFASRVFNAGEEDKVADKVNQALDKTGSKESTYSIDDFNSEDIKGVFGNIDQFVENNPKVYGDSGSFLDYIGSKEAPQGYDQQYGGASTSPPKPLTDMTVGEVLDYQKDMTNNGSASSAVGRYQVLRKTLNTLVSNGVVSPDDPFDATTQDRIAVGLLRLRGLDDWLNGSLSDEQFANNVAHEWASFPLVSGSGKGKSAYAGDGLNKSLGSVDEFLSQLKKLKG